MKRVTYVDEDGYKRASVIRDIDPDELAPQGLPVGVPDLSRLDWDEIQLELHNLLFDKRLFDWSDVIESQNGVTSSIISVMKRKIIALYRE